MSMKCRCGSEDRLSIINSRIVRVSDGKQHLCEYQTAHTENSIFDQKELDNIDECLDRLCIIEEIVTEKLTIGGMAPNPAKVGMYMKFIYDKTI